MDEDRQDPRPEGRAPFETLQALEHADPSVLDDLLGDLFAPDVDPGDPQHRRPEGADRFHECRLVSGTETADKPGVLWAECLRVCRRGSLRVGSGNRQGQGLRNRYRIHAREDDRCNKS